MPRRDVVFVGSFTGTEPPGHGLDVTFADGDDPTLRFTGTVPAVQDASWLELSGDRQTLYVANELPTGGTVTALDVSDPAQPRVRNAKPTLGAGPTHVAVHPNGRHVLVANYLDGTVAVLPVSPGGELRDATDLVRHTGREREAHAHQVVVDPSGRWVLAVDLGTDSIYVYRLDLDTGKLALHQQVVLPSGTGPRHLVFHPNARWAYVAGELVPEIIVAGWDAARGRLAPEHVVPALPPGTTGEQFPAGILLSPDARLVHVAVRGENTIATFEIGRSGATLTRATSVPTGGDWPRHLALDPSERGFYVSNQRSGTVTWLPRDAKTGLPGEPTTVYEVPSVASVLASRTT
jgi:6-phosphogluconolactonase (cycloisomerase 2 family)